MESILAAAAVCAVIFADAHAVAAAHAVAYVHVTVTASHGGTPCT